VGQGLPVEKGCYPDVTFLNFFRIEDLGRWLFLALDSCQKGRNHHSPENKGASVMNQFIELARQGKNNWWRYLFGLVLIAIVPIAVFMAGKTLILRFVYWSFLSYDTYLTLAFALTVGTIASTLIGILLAMRLMHERSFISLITPQTSIDWIKIEKSFGVYFVLLAFTTLLDYLLNPSIYEFRLNLGRFLTFAPVALILIPLDTTAQEVLFRGYLLQWMALGTRNRTALVMASGVLFMLPHLGNPEVAVSFWMAASYYFLVGVFLTVITLKSNSLEMAIGVHAATNLYVALILNYSNSALKTDSIFYCAKLDPVSSLIGFIITSLIFYLIMFGVRKTSRTDAVQGTGEEPHSSLTDVSGPGKLAESIDQGKLKP
jgi:uncharacterized protein